jgi:hypothetical protein
MNHASAWRLDIAREISTWYAGHLGIHMIAVGGSAARDKADAISDIDLCIYWEFPIDAVWLEAVPLKPAGAERFTYRPMFDNEVTLEQYFVGKFKFDVAHLTLNWINTQVDDVLVNLNTSGDEQDLLAGIVDAVALYNEPAYEQFRARVAAYPDALAEKMVNEHLKFYPRWVMEKHGLGRGDLYSFYQFMGEMASHLLGVLGGLNRVYVTTTKLKHLEDIIGRLPIAPPDAAPRLRAAIAGEREAASAVFAGLIADTLDLVDQHMPQVSTERTRYVQQITIDGCEDKPAFPTKQAYEASEAKK